MSNGAVARLPLPNAGKPDAVPAKTELEIKIGTAVASAATALCKMLEQYSEGRLSHEVRMAGGERIAKVVELQMMSTFDEIDFNAIAYREGKAQLRQFFDTDFYRQHGAGAGEATLNNIISEVLTVVERVVALEKAFAN